MIPFKKFNKTIDNKTIQMLVEMSAAEMKSYLKTHIDTATDDELNQMMKAVERPAIEAKITQVFKAKKLDTYIDTSAWDTFVKQLIKVDATVDEKLEFCNKLMKGSYINASGFTKAKTGNVKSFIKRDDKVMKSLFEWFLGWKPEIDVVAVGPAEAIFIFCAADGKKGDPAGDVYMDGKVIEMKVSGGSMGKKGETLWTATKDWFASTVVSATTIDTKEEALKYAPMGGSHELKSIKINTLSSRFRLNGMSDNDIAQFWMNWCSQAMKAKLSTPIKVSKGVVDYDSFARYATGCGYKKYQDQTGFDMVCLIDKSSGDFINFVSGEDFMNRSDYMLDASMDWNGGGQGGGLTARLETKKGTHPTFRSALDVKLVDKQFKEISAIGKAVVEAQKGGIGSKKYENQKAKAYTLLKKLKVSPRLPHQSKITANTNTIVAQVASLKTKQEIQQWVDRQFN